jgi:CRP-like cAMP-binding protein
MQHIGMTNLVKEFMNTHHGNQLSVLSTTTASRMMPRAERGANALLSGIDAAGRSRLKANMELRKNHQGDILFVSGMANDYVYFPEDALISHIYEGIAGTSVEAALIGPEGASGLCSVFDEQPPQYRASVTVSGYAQRIRVSDLKNEVARNSDLQQRLISFLAAHIGELGQRVSCAIYHPAQERLSTWLLLLRDRSGKSNLRLTHDEISSLLGLNRTSVSCIAKRLKDNGSVDYARGKLHISDPALLQTQACECYSILSGSKQSRSGEAAVL